MIAEAATFESLRQLRALMPVWRADPAAFVRAHFRAEPDAWQLEALQYVAKDPKVAMSACKGPGKSCLLAWVVWWFLACHHDAQVIAVSITKDNLRDNLWKELALWRAKSKYLEMAFDFGPGRIAHKARPDTWWASARSFAKDADPTAQANTLAGFHGEHILVVLDEAGDFPGGVLAAAEGIFATEGQHAKLVVAGNPTSTRHALYSIVSRPQGWRLVTITGDPEDPRRSPRISLDYAQSMIAKHGRENPWVMVNILGLFPPSGSMQLIGADLVTRAMGRDMSRAVWRGDARIWGIDPARFGDDEIVLMRRQGVLVREAITWRNKDGVELANLIVHQIKEHEKKGEAPDCIFIDVGGVGSSAYDQLSGPSGYDDLVVPVDFGSGADSPSLYANKRAEMWLRMKDWLEKLEARLPNDSVLAGELQGPDYDFRVVQKHSVYILESKADMKARGVPSPNRADALALTFAAPVHAKSRQARELDGASFTVKRDYDPLQGY